MRTDGKLQLEEKLVDRAADVAVADATKLTAHLTELGRPERQSRRDAAVVERARAEVARDGAIRCVDTHAGEPALRDLAVARGVEAFQFVIDVRAVVGDRFKTTDE